MAAIILDLFKVRSLNDFIASLSTNSLYLGIGRPYFWDLIGNIDTTIPIPTNTIKGQTADWADMMQMKKLAPTDVSNGIYKEQWQPNVKYDAYRHDWDGTRTIVYNGANASVSQPTSIGDVKCFVLTSAYNVYACIKQSVVLGEVQPSIYSPDTGVAVGTNTTMVKTADGYYWKFIAGASASDIIKFSSTYYHPIKTLTVAPSNSDPYYNQWLAQGYSANFAGGIYCINILTAGTGYNSGLAGTRNVTNAETDVQLAVIGDGTGLQYTVIYGAGGTITDIQITNPGNGYTYATIVAAGGTAASFDIVFTLPSGFGADPISDTIARYLIVSTILTGNENGKFTTSNDYRKISLIYNPTNYGTSTVATSATLDACISLNVQTGLSQGAYPIDAIVTGPTSAAIGRVVDFNPTTGAIRIIRTGNENFGSVGANNSFLVGETVNTVPGTGTGIIASLGTPDVQPQSGNIIYTEYRSPILRGPSQTENIDIVVKF